MPRAFLSRSRSEARCTRAKGDATRVVAKLGPVILQVDLMLKDRLLEQVPSVLTTKLRELCKKMHAYNDEAKKLLQSKSPSELSFACDDVGPMVKEVNSTKVVVQNMLNGIRSMSS